MLPVIEIRTYQLREGCAEQFHQTMHQQALVLLSAAGHDVLAALPSADDATTYMLVRAYNSRAHRQSSQDDFYASAAWVDGPRAAIMGCIASYHTVVLKAEPSLIASMRRLDA
jgi:hypothetical protein